MQVNPETLYLEEDMTNQVEFAVDGLFTFGDFPLGGRFKVSGDTAIPDTAIPVTHAQKENRPSFQVPLGFQSSWSVPRPWQNIAGQSTSRGQGKPFQPKSYEPCLKKTIPYVSLCLDNAGKTIVNDATISNIFIKIPDISVSLDSILSEAGTKIGCDPYELILLDVKFFPISDEKGTDHV